MAAQAKWQLSGDYFENCNCDVVCPCLVSPAAPLTSRPTQGTCDVALFFHVDKGSYDTTPLDGLNVAVIGHAPGPMGAGNWTIAAYIDERADDQQTAALGAIFGGAEGGPMAAFAPLIVTHLGAKKVAIRYSINGKSRSAESSASCRWPSSRCRPCIRAARPGQRSVIRSRPTKWRSRWGLPAARLPTTACAGTTPARTATMHRSTGRIDFPR